MSKIQVKSISGEKSGEYEIPDSLLVFDKGQQPVHDAVVAHLANKRAGTASTLTKAEVAGSGRKPWKQKGTGNARAGYRSSPIWKGGGVAFGPKPRAYNKKLTRKMAKLAFRRALSEKIAAGQILLVEDLELTEPKTKLIQQILTGLGIERSALIVVDELSKNLALASRNLKSVDISTAARVSTYQVLRYPVILTTRKGMDVFQKRLEAPAGRG